MELSFGFLSHLLEVGGLLLSDAVLALSQRQLGSRPPLLDGLLRLGWSLQYRVGSDGSMGVLVYRLDLFQHEIVVKDVTLHKDQGVIDFVGIGITVLPEWFTLAQENTENLTLNIYKLLGIIDKVSSYLLNNVLLSLSRQ